MLNTPYLILAGMIVLALWWTGRLSGLSRTARQIARRPTTVTDNAAPLAPASSPTSIQVVLDHLDSHTLGVAFQRAVRREADEQIAVTLAAKSREAAVKAYLEPFSAGGTGPPPPVDHGPP